MCIWQQIYSLFWSSSLWLPKNTTWADVAPGSRPNINYADCKDLLWSLPMAILLITIRYCSEKYIFSPIGQTLGMKSTRSSSKRPTPNRILEQAYIKCNRFDAKTIVGLIKQVDTMTQREIERWWRWRQAQDKPTILCKFSECLWRFIYSICSSFIGLFILWDKPWTWDIEQCLLNHPHHSLDSGVWLYIMVSLSLFLTLIISQFYDVKRKDFWMRCAHHIATVSAISMSWTAHFHRIASLILLYHDFADIFLEAGKLAKYTKYRRLSGIIIVIFVMFWIVTRLVLLPRLLYFCVVKSLPLRRVPLVSCLLFCLLLVLQCIHIVWTYRIYRFVCNALKIRVVKTADYQSSSNSSSEC